ncbi:hypothetical protein F2Q70_00010359 [Brassica cretica]|uniref:Uncharacterized protein n=1 Tax=Brassica cretica TaxID=69181 RepID=A0A8S9LTG9_BRACR|nr:hypothetical protein F2Q70_00010359 [Brassica cretica]
MEYPMEYSEVFRSIVIQKEMKNGDCSIIRRATRVAAPRVHLSASPKDQLRGATREGSRGVDYPLARARRIIEVRRGEGDAGDPHLPLPALPKSFVRGVTRVKQRGITHPLARRRSIVEGPTRGR